MKLVARIGMMLLVASGAAQAAPMTVTFTTGPIGVAAGDIVPVPQATVSGSISYEAASTTSPILSLTGVNLTIAGHAYTLGELTFDSASTTQNVGGAIYGITGLAAGNDFQLTWETATVFPVAFFYTVPAGNTVFSGGLASFSVAPAAVPEPASVGLLALGFGGLAMARRRRSH